MMWTLSSLVKTSTSSAAVEIAKILGFSGNEDGFGPDFDIVKMAGPTHSHWQVGER